MKKKILIILLISPRRARLLAGLLILSSSGFALAQSPTPAPAAAALPTPPAAAAPALTRQARATLIAGQIITQITNILNGAVQIVNSGLPDQPNMPAVDAKDIQNALGPEYVAWLRSASAGPISLPTPTPAPAGK